MTRRYWFVLAAGLSACGRVGPPPDVFTPAIGAWHRTDLRDPPVSESPDPVPRTSVLRYQVAKYEGPGKLEARLYEVSSSGVGLDLAQRWRPSADTVFFNVDRYFVVVKWEQADRKALQEFMSQLEKKLSPQGPAKPPV